MDFFDPLEFGADWTRAQAAVIFMRGHGQTSDDCQEFAEKIACEGVRCLFPRAESGGWFPKSFLEPVEENQPQLGQSLAHYGAILERVRGRGLALDRIILGGFSEGACLTAEFLVRNPRSYGGALILRGGLMDIGAIGRRPGSGLLGVPVYVSASESDEQAPVVRARATIKTLQAGGALIRSHIFTDRPHLIGDEEIVEARKLLAEVKQAAETTA
jgi:predicted esterase